VPPALVRHHLRARSGHLRRFDLLPIVAILVSVLVVLLDSVVAIHARWYI